jgi:hypothetical protein
MTRRKFDYTGHPCEPHHVTDNIWFYVQKDGMTVCNYVAGHNGEVAVIPWRMIKRAIADHEKAMERRP